MSNEEGGLSQTVRTDKSNEGGVGLEGVNLKKNLTPRRSQRLAQQRETMQGEKERN